tara:strand:+ start:6386 stop:9550 length:3165 start_codon:yes stop_codon:yes gene_type:complete
VTDVRTNSPRPSGRRPATGRGGRIAVGLAAGLLILLAALYLNKRAVTRQVLVGWLESQGIDADVAVERVTLDGIIARVRLGDPANPDLVVDRVEVDYGITLPWSSGGAGLTPDRIRLVRPVVRARWQDGKLSFGSLDPLIADVMARPPSDATPGPRILVEGGQVRLTTDQGPVLLQADARVDDGRLMQLTATLPRQALGTDGQLAQGLGGTLRLVTTGDRVALQLTAAADRADLQGWSGRGLRLTATGDLPYPDSEARQMDGQATLDGRLTGDRLDGAGLGADAAVATLGFAGQVTGWIDALNLTGQSDLGLTAGRIGGQGLDLRTLSLRLTDARTVVDRDDRGLGWRLDGSAGLTAARARGAGVDGTALSVDGSRFTLGGRGAAVEAAGPVRLTARQLDWSDLSLKTVTGALDLDLVFDAGLRLEAAGSLRAAHGAWPLFGAAKADDLPDLAAMKRALADFSIDAPRLRLSAAEPGVRLVMDRPVRLAPASGGVLTLTPAAGPVFAAPDGQAGGGALNLTATRGPGLPEAQFAIPAWGLTPGGFRARLDGRAALDFDLARGLTLQTRGVLASNRGTLTYSSADCVAMTVARLELGDNDVTGVTGDLCPDGRPLVTVAGGRWQAGGAVRGLGAEAPFLAMRFAGVDGALTATGGPAGIGLDARIDAARVADTTSPVRFYPVDAGGAARLVDQNWRGTFDLERGGHRLGRLVLAHDGRNGAGGIDITTPELVFAEGGLQPAELTPLAALLGPPVTGTARFAGRIDWAADGAGSSSGLLTVPGLDFVSPAGPVTGLKGDIVFTSLTPLVTAPGQVLTASRLESFAPLTDLDLTFGLDAAAITVAGGELAVAGGTISLEPFSLPLDRSLPFTGVIVLDQVQLGEIIAGAGFGDRVQMDAVVSGRLPFVSDAVRGVKVTGGSLYAARPGRLSIQRTALSDLEAGGGGAVPPGTVEDLAYQAMENLAFDILTAEVNSLDEGRLSVLFHVKGRHDPPQKQEIRLTLSQLIRRDFLNETLPLPSGTAIDLTLDTTLNVNQLVSDLLDLNHARNGGVGPRRP